MFNDATLSGQTGISAQSGNLARFSSATEDHLTARIDAEAGLRGNGTVTMQLGVLVCAYGLVFWLLLSGTY